MRPWPGLAAVAFAHVLLLPAARAAAAGAETEFVRSGLIRKFMQKKRENSTVFGVYL